MDTEVKELRKQVKSLEARLKRQNPKGFSEDFLAFWIAYPKRWTERGVWVKLGQWKAWIQWGRMTKKEQFLAGERVKCVAACKSTQDAFRWLRDKGWIDYENQPKPRKAVAVQKPEPTPEERKKVVEQKEKFLASFGRPPERISQAEFDRRKREGIEKLKGKQ